jgi:hypothetical protein
MRAVFRPMRSAPDVNSGADCHAWPDKLTLAENVNQRKNPAEAGL